MGGERPTGVSRGGGEVVGERWTEKAAVTAAYDIGNC